MRHRFQSNQSNKYGVGPKARRTRGAIVFDSILEATVYDDLVVRCRDGGDVLFFLRQTRIDLPGNTKYVADFLVFFRSGEAEFWDAKGMRTPAYIRSKKQVEDLYPITIREITSQR